MLNIKVTSALKGFHLETTEAMSVVDELTTLDMKYAASAGDIANALARTSAVAQQAGLSMEQAAAAVTVIMDVTQDSAEMTGTAFRSILTRYGNVKTGSFVSLMGDEEDTENLNDIERVLSQLGIRIRSSSMDMRDFSDVLEEVNKKWITLTDVEKNAVATAFAGQRQRNQFLVLMNNYQEYQEALEEANNSQGAAEEKYDAYIGSIEYSEQRLAAAWEDFSQKLEANNALKELADSSAFLIENLDKIIPMLTTLFASLNSYKVPFWLQNIQNFFSPQNANIFNGAGWKIFTKPGQDTAAQNYANKISSQNAEQATENTEQAIQNAGQATDSFSQSLNTASEALNEFTQTVKNNQSTQKQQNQTSNQNQADTGVGSSTGPGSKSPKQPRRPKGIKIGSSDLAVGALSGIATGVMSSEGYTSFARPGRDSTQVNSTSDKVIRGATVGGFAALGSAVFGPIGAMIGQQLGDVITDGILYLKNRDELDRKQRVKEAKEQLEVLQKYTEATTNAIELSKKDKAEFGAEDYQKLDETIKQFDRLLMDDTGAAELLEKSFEKITKTSLSASDAVAGLASASNKVRNQTLSQLTAAKILAEAQAAFNETEVERYDTEEKILEKERERAKYNAKEDEEYDKLTKEITRLNNQLKSYEDALKEEQLKASFYLSGMSNSSTSELRQMSLEEARFKILEDWGELNPSVYNASGGPTSSAISQIDNFLRAQGLEELFTNSSLAFSQISGRAMNLKGKKLSGSDYEKLIASAMAKNSNDQQLKDLMKAYGVKEDDYAGILRLLGNTNPEKLKTIANGFSLTIASVESFGRLKDVITAEDALSVQKYSEKLQDLSNVFVELTTKATLSSENMQKVLNKFPAMLFDKNGNWSPDSMASNILSILTSGDAGLALGGSIAQASRTDKTTFSLFKEKNAELLKEADLTSVFEKVTTYDEAINSEDERVRKFVEDRSAEFAKIAAKTSGAYDFMNQVQQKAIELGEYYIDQQIEGLTSIRDSLDEINKARERELQILKAREAFENALNEKKRVYRAGIGFTYQADQTQVTQAKEELEKLEREQEKENWQYQIDILEQQKSILENIEKNKELERLTDSFSTFIGNETFSKLIEALDVLEESSLREQISEGTEKGYEEYQNTIRKKEAEHLIKDLNDAYEELSQAKANYDKAETPVEKIASLQKMSEAYEKYNTAYEAAEQNTYAKSAINTQNQAASGSGRRAANSKAYASVLEEDVPEINKDLVLHSGQRQLLTVLYGNKAGQQQYNFKVDRKTNPSETNGRKSESIYYYPALRYGDTIFSKDQATEQFGVMSELAIFDPDSGTINTEAGYYTNEIGEQKEYSSLEDFLTRSPYAEPYTILYNTDWKNYAGYIDSQGNIRYMINGKVGKNGEFIGEDLGQFDLENLDYTIFAPSQRYASGAFSTGTGTSLINERGLEGIITPSGTLTSLPAHSGVVPADLTRNLYVLGQEAPTIVKRLGGENGTESSGILKNEDNSTNISHLYASFDADAGFNFEKFLREIRSVVATSNNNH